MKTHKKLLVLSRRSQGHLPSSSPYSPFPPFLSLSSSTHLEYTTKFEKFMSVILLLYKHTRRLLFHFHTLYNNINTMFSCKIELPLICNARTQAQTQECKHADVEAGAQTQERRRRDADARTHAQERRVMSMFTTIVLLPSPFFCPLLLLLPLSFVHLKLTPY